MYLCELCLSRKPNNVKATKPCDPVPHSSSSSLSASTPVLGRPVATPERLVSGAPLSPQPKLKKPPPPTSPQQPPTSAPNGPPSSLSGSAGSPMPVKSPKSMRASTMTGQRSMSISPTYQVVPPNPEQKHPGSQLSGIKPDHSQMASGSSPDPSCQRSPLPPSPPRFGMPPCPGHMPPKLENLETMGQAFMPTKVNVLCPHCKGKMSVEELKAHWPTCQGPLPYQVPAGPVHLPSVSPFSAASPFSAPKQNTSYSQHGKTSHCNSSQFENQYGKTTV